VAYEKSTKLTLNLDSGTDVDLVLQKQLDGSISVREDDSGVDSQGWYLVTFETNGTITRHSSIGDETGFQLTKLNRVKIAKD
jgi:hypothetical protein